MSDKSLHSLGELARFVGQSTLTAENEFDRVTVVNGMVYGLAPRFQRRSVNDLLAAVMALSARTRRMLMPPVAIELDVFSPGGKRAVSVQLPDQTA